MLSRRRLARQKVLPRATVPWVLDSGGFTEVSTYGRWTIGPEEYVDEVKDYADRVGSMAWAAPMDWMCEPFITEKTGMKVLRHQELTVENFCTLQEIAPELPFIPVLQGYTIREYLHCIDLYRRNGIYLSDYPIVGVGSVCRRQHSEEILAVLRELAAYGIPLHGFGMKALAFRIGAQRYLASADSMAWSYNARRNPPLPGCKHPHCSNCMKWALAWRERVLERTSRAALPERPSARKGAYWSPWPPSMSSPKPATC